MTSSNSRQRGVGGLLLAAALFPATASAQPVIRPVEVYGTVGWERVLVSDSVPEGSEVGGGARLFLTRRFAVQGDLLRSRSHVWYLQDAPIGYVSFAGTWGPTTRIVRPYWLVGVSMRGGDRNRLLLNGGLGARIFVGDRYFLAPEIRSPILGWRASISGGIALELDGELPPSSPTLLQQGGTPVHDSHKIEVFAGYSYLPQLDDVVKNFDDSGHGWGTSLSVNLRRHLDLIADFDTHSWTTHERWVCSASVTGTATTGRQPIRLGCADTYIGESDTTLYYLSVGPRFVVPANRVVLFALAAGEYQTSHFSGLSIVGPAQRSDPGRTPGELVTQIVGQRSAAAGGLGVGGGADISVTRRLAVRAIQINYAVLAFGEGPGRKLSLKSGLVLKF